jgi:predicted nucleic acid-binding protein
MISSSFSADPNSVFVLDASVVINLNATGRAADIITTFPNRFVVTDNACVELEGGASRGHDDAKQLQSLIDADNISRVRIGRGGLGIYEALIDGSARLTLDDGEAATIACAIELAGVALIDERKARRLCSASFPALSLVSTAQLLLHASIVAAHGPDFQRDAVLLALKAGRMRVPRVYVADVIALIGQEQAASCTSLPKVARNKFSG